MVKRVRLSPMPMDATPSLVLITESAEEFEAFSNALHAELKPRGPLERYLVDDIAGKMWEVRRLCRVKTSLINSAFRPGLKMLLMQLKPFSGGGSDHYDHWGRNLSRLADQWFGDEREKNEVLEILKEFKLDESAIEAAAMRFLNPDLEKIDRLMASQEARLNKSLRSLAELCSGFGRAFHANMERVIEGKTLALEGAAKQPPPEQA